MFIENKQRTGFVRQLPPSRADANFVLVAQISYRDTKTNKIILRKKVQVARVYSFREGNKFINDIKKMEFEKVVGLNEDSTPILEKFMGKRPTIVGWNENNGLTMRESFDRFLIVPVKEYIGNQ